MKRSNLLKADNVGVQVADGIVTLSGSVTGNTAKNRVYDIAAHTFGTVKVISKINTAKDIT